MGKVNVTHVSDIDPLQVTKVEGVEPLEISKFEGVEALRIGQIAPVAVHIRELNHIDPISVESLRIDEVQNIEPLRIERLDVTGVPPLNLSVRQIPAVDLNVRRVPPVSLGLHQDFVLPSNYTVHAKVLGVELVRLQIHGRTNLTPRDRVRRESAQTHERSFPEVASVGNPAIPVNQEEVSAEVVRAKGHRTRRPPPRKRSQMGPGKAAGRSEPRRARRSPRSKLAPLNAGSPHFQFAVPKTAPVSDASVSSGDL